MTSPSGGDAPADPGSAPAAKKASRAGRNLPAAIATGVVLAALGGFALIYINLAVGIIGDEQNPRNLVFFAIPALGYVGALIGRFRAPVMIRLLIGMAAVQFSTVLMAPADMLRIMIPFTGLFVGLWLLSALLIRRSIRP